MKALLFTSIAINLALAGLFVSTYFFNETSDLDSKSSTLDKSSYVSQFQNSKSNAEHRAELLELETKLVSSQLSPAVYYWEPISNVVSQIMEQQNNESDWVRAELLKQFGEAVYEEPAFAKYFYPLGAGFEFLNSEQQIEIVNLRSNYQASMVSVSGGMEAFQQFQRRESEYLQKVNDLIGDEAFLEFQLRESQLAKQMRNSDFDWTESEFRDVFKIRNQQMANGPLSANPVSGVLYDEEVKQALGTSRYTAYLKATDPMYARIEAQLQQSGGNESQAEEIYEIYADYSQQISEAKRDKDLQLAFQLQAERDQQLDGAGIQLRQGSKLPFQLPEGSMIRAR